jgi:hypothetical protein
MPVLKADGNWNVWNGILAKSGVAYGRNSSNERAFAGYLGVGVCVPVNYCLTLVPSVGYNYNYVKMAVHQFRPSFSGYGPYAALEATYNFASDWRLIGSVQYSWNRTKRQVKAISEEGIALTFTNKDHSHGMTYGLMLEHDLSECLSINAGGLYNGSLDREDLGIRYYGFKVGTAYWF